MLYALICTDKPDAGELRQMVRPEHVGYLTSLGDALKMAGPFTADDGKPVGSLVIVEAEDRDAAGKIADADPYAKAGLFRAVEIRGFKWTLKNPESA
jgi:uncharacterized protein YciI